MAWKSSMRTILNIHVMLYISFFWGSIVSGQVCIVNDDCQNAIIFPDVISDQSIICLSGCNLYASPDSVIQACQMGDFPTVWYQLELDDVAEVMNVEVYSPDIESPVISIFKSTSGCDNLEQVLLTNSNLACIIGSAGVAKVIGTPVDVSLNYYIAISSLNSTGGNFDLCISTLSTGFVCVLDRSIEITDRENGGPLEGPFDPNEKVSFCINVNEFTASNNGCQWFQGIVPVFGNGWDPSSYSATGQPNNASLNGNSFDPLAEGVYGSSVWSWFDNVGYHHDHPSLNISDLDNNGSLDMCNSVYEVDCPFKGVMGGSVGPCWEDQGDLLPAGWFAYGVNGTCPTPGPPIAVDWGDGNTCGGGMGSWSFCFDLTTRDVPDCMEDSTKRNLTLGFFTFADGEVGSWTGNGSVCRYDYPLKLSLKAKCGRVTQHDVEDLPPLCTGDTLQYQISEPGIDYWEWNISPFTAVPYMQNQGDNGFTIAAPLTNETGQPVDIKGILIGRTLGTEDIVLRKFKFKLLDPATCSIVAEESPHETMDQLSNKIRIYPMPVDESAILEWSFDLQKEAYINIYDAQGVWLKNISVTPNDVSQKRIETESLIPGLYFISFENTDFRYMAKLVRM